MQPRAGGFTLKPFNRMTRQYIRHQRPYAGLGAVKDAFEASFFRHLILAMDHYFDNRLRTLELKDGNPVNEVRVLCNSIMHNHHKLLEDSQIRLDPAKSVLGLKTGDDIRLTAPGFKRLADAFFNEISAKYQTTT